MDTVLIVCPTCSKRIPRPAQFPLICSCGTHINCDSHSIRLKPPRWVKVLSYLSKPEDVGLGATVKRIADKVGGERFKAWATKLGIPCGCTEREAHWNKLYPNPHYRQP